ncbi:unnamed protein product [Linum trigynum]|uniref:Reverse transcriptase domain-containing protein n=1 Tax=Linum trigynum TaxID=586398 RepID=A0AAV2ERX0_9ROSI
MLKDETGAWVEDEQRLQDMARMFFQLLYTDEPSSLQSLPSLFPNVTEEFGESTSGTFTDEEVRRAVMGMGALKAPGSDGLHPLFFQKFWPTVGAEVIQFARDCWTDPTKVKLVNETILVLIPKVSRPSLIEQYRPISLCNVTYKILTKCLAERLKMWMPSLVDETQTSFVPGRHITDNVCILQEVVHSMRAKTGRKGWISKLTLLRHTTASNGRLCRILWKQQGYRASLLL